MQLDGSRARRSRGRPRTDFFTAEVLTLRALVTASDVSQDAHQIHYSHPYGALRLLPNRASEILCDYAGDAEIPALLYF
jgi:hypothetical protein